MECTTQRVLVCFVAFLVLVLLAAVISYCWGCGPLLSKPAIFCGSAAAVLGGGLAAWRGGRRASVRRAGAKPPKVGGGEPPKVGGAALTLKSAADWATVKTNAKDAQDVYQADQKLSTDALAVANRNENAKMAAPLLNHNTAIVALQAEVSDRYESNSITYITEAVAAVNGMDITALAHLHKALQDLKTKVPKDRDRFLVELLKSQDGNNRTAAVGNLKIVCDDLAKPVVEAFVGRLYGPTTEQARRLLEAAWVADKRPTTGDLFDHKLFPRLAVLLRGEEYAASIVAEGLLTHSAVASVAAEAIALYDALVNSTKITGGAPIKLLASAGFIDPAFFAAVASVADTTLRKSALNELLIQLAADDIATAKTHFESERNTRRGAVGPAQTNHNAAQSDTAGATALLVAVNAINTALPPALPPAPTAFDTILSNTRYDQAAEDIFHLVASHPAVTQKAILELSNNLATGVAVVTAVRAATATVAGARPLTLDDIIKELQNTMNNLNILISSTIPNDETAQKNKKNAAVAEAGKAAIGIADNPVKITAELNNIAAKVNATTTYEFANADLLTSIQNHAAELQTILGTTVILPTSVATTAPPLTSLEIVCNSELATLKQLDDDLLALQAQQTKAVGEDTAADTEIARLASELIKANTQLGGNTSAHTMVNELKTANVDEQRAVSALGKSDDGSILALCAILIHGTAYQASLTALGDSGPAITDMFIKLRTTFTATPSVIPSAATAATTVEKQKIADEAVVKSLLDTATFNFDSADLAKTCADRLKSVDEATFQIVDLINELNNAYANDPADTLDLLLAMAPLFKIISDAAKISLKIEKTTTTAGAGAAHALAVANILFTAAGNIAVTNLVDFITANTSKGEVIAARALQALATALNDLNALPSRFDHTNIIGAPKRLIDTVVTSLLTMPLQSSISGKYLNDDINEVHIIVSDPSIDDNSVETIFKDCNDPPSALDKYSKQIDTIAAVNASALTTELDKFVANIKGALAASLVIQYLLGINELKRPFIDMLKAPTAPLPSGITLLQPPSGGSYLGESIWGPLIWETLFALVLDDVNTKIPIFANLLIAMSALWKNYKLPPPTVPGDIEDLIRWYVLAKVFSAQEFDYKVEIANRLSKELAAQIHMDGMIAAYFAGTASSYKAFCKHRLEFEHPALTIARDFVGFGNLTTPKFTAATAQFEGQLPEFADRSAFAGVLTRAVETTPLPVDPPVACLSWEFSNVFSTPKAVAFYHADCSKYWETVKASYLNDLTARFTASLPLAQQDAITGQQLQSGFAFERLESYWVDKNAKWSDVLSLVRLDYNLPVDSFPKISIEFGSDGCYGVPLTLSGAVKGLTDVALLGYADYIVALVSFANEFNLLGMSGGHALAQATNSIKIIDLYNGFLGVCEACKGDLSVKENYEYLVVKHIQLEILIDMAIPSSFVVIHAAGGAVKTAFGKFSTAMAGPVAAVSAITKLADTSLTNVQSERVKKTFLAFVKAFNDAVTTVENTDLLLTFVRTALGAIGASADDLDTNNYQKPPDLSNAKDSNTKIMALVGNVQALVLAYPTDPTVVALLQNYGVFMVEPLLAIENSLAALETAAADLIPSSIQKVLLPITFDGEGIDNLLHIMMSGKTNYPDDTVRGIGGPCSRFYNAMYGRKSRGALTLYRTFRKAQRLENSTTDPLAAKVFTLAWTISNLSFELAARIGEDLNKKASDIIKAITAFKLEAVALRDEVHDHTKYPDNILTAVQRDAFRDKIDAAIAELGKFPALSALFVSSYIVPVNRSGNTPQTLLSEEQKLINYETPPTAAFTVAHQASEIPEDSHIDYLVVAKSPEELQAMKFHKGGRQIFGLVVDAIKPGEDVTALYKAAAIVIGLHPPPEIKAASANRTKGARGWLFRIVRYSDSDVHHLEQITYINSSMYAVST